MKTGLVLEGGSRQTIFTAGVLDAFMDENIDFSYYAGVSAGGHAAVNYITRQRGRFRYIIMPTKLQQGKKAHKLLDGPRKESRALHYASPYGEIPFDFKTFFNAKVECEFGLTCCETGRTEFKSEKKDEKRLLDLLSASSALPMLFPVAALDDKHYVDGCVTAPIPYERAFEMGCDKVVAISTHYPGEIVTDFRKYRAILNPMFKRKYNGLFRALMVRYKRYQKIFEHMETLQKQGKLFLIRPEKELCDLFETDLNKLNLSYEYGIKTALQKMDDIKTFLEI